LTALHRLANELPTVWNDSTVAPYHCIRIININTISGVATLERLEQLPQTAKAHLFKAQFWGWKGGGRERYLDD